MGSDMLRSTTGKLHSHPPERRTIFLMWDEGAGDQFHNFLRNAGFLSNCQKSSHSPG